MKKFLALMLALVLAVGLCACTTAPVENVEGEVEGEVEGTPEGENEGEAEVAPIKVGVLVPAVTHGWVGGIAYNAEQYCKELSEAGTIEYKLLTSSNAEEMTAQLDEVKLWGAQAIVIAPQWTGMEVAAKAAIDEGIAVVAFDMDIPAEGIYKVTGDNESMGIAGAQYIVEKIGTEGLVVTMPVPTAGSVSELRMKGFKETMAQIAPEVEIIDYANAAFSREEGLKVMADILTANAEIDAVFSLDDETSIGALQAIADAGRTDIKAITGGGGCQEYFGIIKESADIAACSALYSPLMIKDCLDVAVAVVNGEEVEAVKIIPSQIVDAANADEYIDPSSTIY